MLESAGFSIGSNMLLLNWLLLCNTDLSLTWGLKAVTQRPFKVHIFVR